MSKRTLMNCFIVGSVVLVGSALGVTLSKSGAMRRLTHPTPRAAQRAADTRSLREKAKGEGRHIDYREPMKVGAFSDLAGLAENSPAVVIGIPQENASALSPDGKSATIDYKVKIMYVFKGALKKDSFITVGLPGGKVSFKDGSTAEVRTPWFKKMMNGKAYALFLTPTTRANYFVTTGEAQGLFLIPATEKEGKVVESHVGLPQDPMWKYHHKDVKEFLQELRRITGKPLKS